jgi:hypothetical protein
MKKGPRISYRVESDYDFDGEYGRTFRSFRRARSHLIWLDDDFTTLARVSRKGGIDHHRSFPDAVVACWKLNARREVIRFSRRCFSLARKEAKQKARQSRVRLTLNGHPYTIPHDFSIDIPF